jgi:hypothetical protein
VIGYVISGRAPELRAGPFIAVKMESLETLMQADNANELCARIDVRRDGGTGRRSGLKIRRGQPHGGSIPPPGTKIRSTK